MVDLQTGKIQGALKPHQASGNLALSQDGRWLATAGWHSDKVCLWDVSTGELVHVWPKPTATRVSFARDSRTLVLSTGEKFEFWDVISLKKNLTFACAEPLYSSQVVFTSDGALMALELTPGVIDLKDTKTGRTVARLEDPSGARSTWTTFSPDGTQFIASSNYTKAIRVWDLPKIRVRLKEMGLDWNWPEFPDQTNRFKPDR